MKELRGLSCKEMKRMLKNRFLKDNVREEINKRLDKNFEDSWKWLKQIDNVETNKFYNLAIWQLYREGKAKKYRNGEKEFFVIDDKNMIFDKMIEIRQKFSIFEMDGNKKTNEVKEFSEWKR